MTLSLEIGGAPTHSRFSRSYFKITPMDGCLLIGLPHFPPRKNKLPHSLCQGVRIEKKAHAREGERKSKKRSTPLHPSSCFEYAQGRKSIDRSPIPRILFTHIALIYLPEIQGVYRHRHKETSGKTIEAQQRKKNGGHRKPYGCYSPQADNDIVVLPDQKTTTTQPAKKSGTRPSLIQTDRSRTFRPFLIPQETRK
jgi:hypothetical protein